MVTAVVRRALTRLLGITAIPGGPALERLAATSANPNRFTQRLPLPLSNSKSAAVRQGADFSFAGLKTGRAATPRRLLPLPPRALPAAGP